MFFADDLNAFAAKLRQRNRDVFTNIASATKFSWTDGSAITGSPGVPVQTSNLKGSIQLTFPSDGVAEITATGIAPDGTPVGYAAEIEYNLRGATLRSAVGGFHARALTIAGFPRLVDAEVAKVVNS